jgi:hypothetical protein
MKHTQREKYPSAVDTPLNVGRKCLCRIKLLLIFDD